MWWGSGEKKKSYSGVKRSLFSQVDKAVKPLGPESLGLDPRAQEAVQPCLAQPPFNFKLVSSLQEGSLTYPALHTNAPV